MEHLDLAMNIEQEAVYGDTNKNDESSSEMSDRVSSLAGSIYAEFEKMIQKYGSDVVETLMPLVVNVLEQLETSYNESNEQSVELEMLAEDNEQLMTQYEREKQLRKLAESKYLEYEDSREDDRKENQNYIDQLEHLRKQEQIKIKNLQDQVDRLEERSLEQKKEYEVLHTRHTEMLHAYMERLEMQAKMSPGTSDNGSLGSYKKHQQSIAVGLISASQPNLAVLSPGKSNNLRSASSTQLITQPTALDAGESRNDLSFEDEANKGEEVMESESNVSVVKSMKRLAAPDLSRSISQEIPKPVSSEQDTKQNDDSNNRTSDVEQENNMLNVTPKKGEFNVTDEYVSELEAQTSSELLLSPEARAILQSTPELLKSHSRINEVDVFNTSPLDITGAQRQRQLDVSLFAEMQSESEDVAAPTTSELEASTVSEYTVGVTQPQGLREFDLMLDENRELIELRDKLQIQKNDLLRRVEDLAGDKEVQEEEINGLKTTKQRMKLKISELEQQLKKVKLENDKAQLTIKNKLAQEQMSSANRKRFTRVEMAKVLMERNQYKERLMELQEAVRWTEMIRASKENHIAALQQKKKSSIWKLFSNLFAGSGGGGGSANTSPKKTVPTPQQQQQPINVWYGSNQGSNAASRRNSMLGSTNNHPSRHQGDSGFEGMTERQRQERKERYKIVKEHINSEGRKQAYGWSLPANYSGNQSGPMAVPIPVYCRPLNTDPAMKIWCASGINLEGGRTPDGNFVNLPADLKEPLPSTVWIGTSTHSCSKITIIDANNPSNALDQFIVSSSHLLCMAAVSGLTVENVPQKESNAPTQLPRASRSIGGSGSVTRQLSPEHAGSVMGIQAEEESFADEDMVDGSFTSKITSVLPTMWLGAQSGKVYIHSVVSNWKKCLQSTKLKDSLLSIVHIKGRVLAALADGTVAIFHRKPDGRWDLSNYHLLDLGRPHHSIRCMAQVQEHVWCGYRNKIQVINPITMRIEKSFDAHPRRESQVRQLACVGDGVWVSIRLDSTLRLYNAHTYHHLQDVDIEPYVSKMLGTSKLGFSFVRITALLLTDDRLWVGTGNGTVLSVPLVSSRPTRDTDSETSKVALTTPDGKRNAASKFMPYCAMVHAQLSFHGHRDSVKFFLAVPGSAANVEAAKAYTNAGARPPSPSNVGPGRSEASSLMVMSGGEGYIDFRVGDEDNSESSKQSNPSSDNTGNNKDVVTVERSHLLVWQVGGTIDQAV